MAVAAASAGETQAPEQEAPQTGLRNTSSVGFDSSIPCGTFQLKDCCVAHVSSMAAVGQEVGPVNHARGMGSRSRAATHEAVPRRAILGAVCGAVWSEVGQLRSLSSPQLGEHLVGLARENALLAIGAANAYADRELVSGLIHAALLQAGLGRADPDRPFADVVHPGTTVLLKPNWVMHRNLGGHGTTCLTTAPEFIEAVLEEVLKAHPKRIILGDGPIQSCELDELLPEGFQLRLREMAASQRVDLEFADFRRTSIVGLDFVNGVQTHLRGENKYVLFDLAKDSLLEPISRPVGTFRVTDYDPGKLAETHRPGRHRYLVCREAFEADVVLSLPKLKLHCKAGLTGALKNLVGLCGCKDYLPHHRVGGSETGGDCYPGRSLRKRAVEFLLDKANRRIQTRAYIRWRQWASIVRRRVAKCDQHKFTH